MAGRGGTKQVATAVGVAAGAGAAQLGLGYGLGVVVWPVASGADDSVWLGSLGWATWIAGSSTVIGAVLAGRLGPARGGLWRLALALAAAVGALLTVALVALPARLAERPQTVAPETVAAGYAVAGVLIGVVIAYWAVYSRPVAANVILTTAYLWALAAAAIIVELTTGRDSATYLTSWQFADAAAGTRYGSIAWPSALLTLLGALLIGMLAVWPAVRRGHFTVGAATSGAVGPLLVAAAFLVLAPQLTSALGQLGSAYLIAPYAVLAGLAGSAFMVALGQRAAEYRKHEHHRPAPPPATGVATVLPEQDPADPASLTTGEHRPVRDRAAEPVTDAPGQVRLQDEVTAELTPVRPVTRPAESARAGSARAGSAPAGPAPTATATAGPTPAASAGSAPADLAPVGPTSARSASAATPGSPAPRSAVTAPGPAAPPPAVFSAPARPPAGPATPTRPTAAASTPAPAARPPATAPAAAPPPAAAASAKAAPRAATGTSAGAETGRARPAKQAAATAPAARRKRATSGATAIAPPGDQPDVSTVAAPPASPPVARINPPVQDRDGE